LKQNEIARGFLAIRNLRSRHVSPIVVKSASSLNPTPLLATNPTERNATTNFCKGFLGSYANFQARPSPILVGDPRSTDFSQGGCQD